MIHLFRTLLNMHKISIRHIFSEFRNGKMTLDKKKFLNVFEKENNKVVTSYIFYLYCVNSVIDLPIFFDKVEARKSFVFIVPSYNNIDNYMINMTSIQRQCRSYPRHLFRTIYIVDTSTDGTDDA